MKHRIFIVKAEESWYAKNKDALKAVGHKVFCVLKTSKLVQENQRLIEELREKTLEYDEKIKLLEEAKAIYEKTRVLLDN